MSKRERIDSMLRRAVMEQIQATAFYATNEEAVVLRKLASQIYIGAAFNISGDPYRMKELADIMAWKKGPKV